MPATYFVCERDVTLPVPVQEHMAQLLGPSATVVRASSSHFPYLSMPDRVVEAVVGAAREGMRAIRGDDVVAVPAQQGDAALDTV